MNNKYVDSCFINASTRKSLHSGKSGKDEVDMSTRGILQKSDRVVGCHAMHVKPSKSNSVIYQILSTR